MARKPRPILLQTVKKRLYRGYVGRGDLVGGEQVFQALKARQKQVKSDLLGCLFDKSLKLSDLEILIKQTRDSDQKLYRNLLAEMAT